METWTTRDGDEIPLNKLKDDHLINIKQFIERRARYGMLVQMGGGGQDIDEMWYDEDYLEGQEVFDHFNYKAIMKEIGRRKLKVSKYKE